MLCFEWMPLKKYHCLLVDSQIPMANVDKLFMYLFDKRTVGFYFLVGIYEKCWSINGIHFSLNKRAFARRLFQFSIYVEGAKLTTLCLQSVHILIFGSYLKNENHFSNIPIITIDIHSLRTFYYHIHFIHLPNDLQAIQLMKPSPNIFHFCFISPLNLSNTHSLFFICYAHPIARVVVSKSTEQHIFLGNSCGK